MHIFWNISWNIFKTSVQFGENLEARTLIVDNLSLFEKQIFTLEIEISSTKTKLFEELAGPQSKYPVLH